MLKVITPYSTTTEPKLVRCQPRAQTIILMLGNRVRLLDSTNTTRKVLDVLDSNFQTKFITIRKKNFSFEKVMVLHRTTAQPC